MINVRVYDFAILVRVFVGTLETDGDVGNSCEYGLMRGKMVTEWL